MPLLDGPVDDLAFQHGREPALSGHDQPGPSVGRVDASNHIAERDQLIERDAHSLLVNPRELRQPSWPSPVGVEVGKNGTVPGPQAGEPSIGQNREQLVLKREQETRR